jgi:hypothetical protein
MRLIYLTFFLYIVNSGFSFGQLPSSVRKMEGNWRYKQGSGYESWRLKDDQLIGHAFRLSKAGDTSEVESFVIKKVNNHLVYDLSTFINQNDTLVTTNRTFLGGKRKISFVNLAEDVPYSIQYKFAFLNKNKLKITVLYTIDAKPQKFVLYRIKE